MSKIQCFCQIIVSRLIGRLLFNLVPGRSDFWFNAPSVNSIADEVGHRVKNRMEPQNNVEESEWRMEARPSNGRIWSQKTVIGGINAQNRGDESCLDLLCIRTIENCLLPKHAPQRSRAMQPFPTIVVQVMTSGNEFPVCCD
jgi:hypothetical protein